MPKTKIYNIVTNDELEMPLAVGVIGAKAVSAYTGLTVNRIRKSLFYDNWGRSKYKAVEVGLVENNQEAYMIKYNLTHDRSEYWRERAWTKKRRKRERKQ